MSIYPHMHMLGKEMECYAVTPTSDTINLIRINKWDFDWQGAYLFKKFIKIPAGSMIYATGSYDNTISASNPNPIMVQSGLNTDDEMFIFIFQYTDYQLGDENIFIEEQFNVSSTSNIADNFLKKIILKTNLLGKRSRSIKNNVSIFIHEDGEFEKKIIID